MMAGLEAGILLAVAALLIGGAIAIGWSVSSDAPRSCRGLTSHHIRPSCHHIPMAPGILPGHR